MKIFLKALLVLATILGFGWLIFDLGGVYGAFALGVLIGIVVSLSGGVYVHNRTAKGGGHG